MNKPNNINAAAYFYTIEQGISEEASNVESIVPYELGGKDIADYEEFMFYISGLLEDENWQDQQDLLSLDELMKLSKTFASLNMRKGDMASIQASKKGICLAVIVAEAAISSKQLITFKPIRNILQSSKTDTGKVKALYDLYDESVEARPYATAIIDDFIDTVESNIDVQRQCKFAYHLTLHCIEEAALERVDERNTLLARVALKTPPSHN